VSNDAAFFISCVMFHILVYTCRERPRLALIW
jgi:hypothetical protein